jgi:hypothetical protein
VSATPGGLGSRGLSGDLGSVERRYRSVDQVCAHADESVAMPNADVIGFAGDAVFLEQTLKVARFRAVAPAHADEDLADGCRVVRRL